jgi:ppGpp synthetase/RelA/SpoT-type nucleotidyltranferase
MDWNQYWENLVAKKKYANKISEMDDADDLLGHELHIEQICHMIYDDYECYFRKQLEGVRQDFLNVLDTFENVHLQTSRVKTINSLLGKIIEKRYQSLNNPKSGYVGINADNYRDIVTDLIGMRVILNYRGNWQLIHQEILKVFRYDRTSFDGKEKNVLTLSHPADGSNIVAQIPIAYYAMGDDYSEYQRCGLNVKLHKMGYRSIHYTVSFESVYIELQVRTIYDEAWSDCDHNYVYKHDDNPSHTALETISHILSDLTNISNDIGEYMKMVYDTKAFKDAGNGKWSASAECIQQIKTKVDKLGEVYIDCENFLKCIQTDQEE